MIVLLRRSAAALADAGLLAHQTPDQPEATGVGLSEEIERVMRENGLSDEPGQFDSNIHSWRCEHPDRYGPCSCFQELRDDLTRILAARLAGVRDEREVKAEGLRELADDLDPRPLGEPCENAEACCGSTESCDAARPITRLVSAKSVRDRADRLEADR